MRPRSVLIAVAVSAVCAGCFGESEQRMVSQGSGGPGVDPVTGEQLPPFVPAPLSMRRLLGWQYRAAVNDLLGPEAAIVVSPPQDSAVNGFDSIGAAQLSLSAQGVDLYEKSAHAAAETALQDASRTAALIPCTPQSATDAGCYQQVVETFGRRAFRRPLTPEEVQTWVNLGVEAGTAYGDFSRGVEFVIAGLLQSPNFLYVVEVGEPDPADATRLRLTGYELATRLSFFLSGTLPDDELMQAAESGALMTADGVRAQAQRLLQKPEARVALQRFFDEAFQLRDLNALVKDPAAFPEFTPALAKAMQQETQLFLNDLVWERDADFRGAFDATYTFVNQDLAALYGVSGAPATGFGRVELDPNGRRGGLLGQAGFLSMMAHPNATSPTFRGKFVRERLLCKQIPAPPDNVNTNLDTTGGTQPQTLRQKLMVHQQNPACAGCHVLMDDIGFGLENFDALGRYRDLDNGLPVDASSTFDDKGAFAGALQLGHLLHDDPRVTSCLVRNVYRMAVGHIDTDGETAPLRMAELAFADGGYRMKGLLVELAASDAFRYATAPEVTP